MLNDRKDELANLPPDLGEWVSSLANREPAQANSMPRQLLTMVAVWMRFYDQLTYVDIVERLGVNSALEARRLVAEGLTTLKA